MKVFDHTMRIFGKRLHALLYSPRGEAVLRMDPENTGTWVAGGCNTLALALNELTGWPLYGLYGSAFGGSNQFQHVFVGFGGFYVDAEGAWTEQELLKRWFELERVDGRITPYNPEADENSGLGSCPVGQIEALKKLLAPLLEKA